jgi:uncharacterized membrane protein YfcA
VPFSGKNVGMEIAGSIVMFALITFSNMGGLSGAGTNVPIMLIFYGLTMPQIVPLSSFVAVCSTVFRFLYNFNKAHPNAPERVVINYEVVEITMPCVFLGSFAGIKIGKMIGEIAQVCIFGITVAWSIQTTTKRVFKLREKEALKAK